MVVDLTKRNSISTPDNNRMKTTDIKTIDVKHIEIYVNKQIG